MNKSLLNSFINSLNRIQKQFIMIAFDVVALTAALWSGYALRLADWWPHKYLNDGLWLFIITPIMGVIIFTKFGLYRAVVRYFGGQAVIATLKGVFILTLSLYAASVLLEISNFPRSVPVNFALAATLYVGGTRLAVRNYYHWLIANLNNKERVIIYGAGSAGIQLASALTKGKEFTPISFIDDNKTLWGRNIQGIKVGSPDDIPHIIESRAPSQILVALPTATPFEKSTILNKLATFKIQVKVMPSMPQIVEGELPTLRSVKIEDLLGRSPVSPLPGLIEKSIKGKNVLITGAGGSIGSELVRQSVAGGAKQVVLYEQSELALYEIDKELKKTNIGNDTPIIPILGSVLNQDRLETVLKKYEIQTMYHAAAYKHVPLVEHNITEGLNNNTIGTLKSATAAKNTGVERFVLISTDKAVRPTNIMGATKRAAEIIVQYLSTQSSKTIFSMVRFGNVLGSSGSVVPLFSQQIKSGGPVTVTHKDINRYFMTIPEAASLVIQAGSMAEGGEVFVLDMGEVVKISDLAEKMITLMGKELKTDTNPNGNIEIQYTGLRPGEKLYEELLIGDNVSDTSHTKIMMANEELLDEAELLPLIENITKAVESNQPDEAKIHLTNMVKEYKAAEMNVDWLSDNSSWNMAGNKNIGNIIHIKAQCARL